MNADLPDTPLSRFLATRDRAELTILRNQIRQELDASEQRLAMLRGQLTSVEWALAESARAHPAELKTDTTDEQGAKPALRLAILAVMNENPQRTDWDRRAVFEALSEKGWQPKGAHALNQVGNRLSSLAEDGEVARTPDARGRYYLPRPETRSMEADQFGLGDLVGEDG